MSYITTKACHDLKACYVTRGLSYVRTYVSSVCTEHSCATWPQEHVICQTHTYTLLYTSSCHLGEPGESTTSCVTHRCLDDDSGHTHAGLHANTGGLPESSAAESSEEFCKGLWQLLLPYCEWCCPSWCEVCTASALGGSQPAEVVGSVGTRDGCIGAEHDEFLQLLHGSSAGSIPDRRQVKQYKCALHTQAELSEPGRAHKSGVKGQPRPQYSTVEYSHFMTVCLVHTAITQKKYWSNTVSHAECYRNSCDTPPFQSCNYMSDCSVQSGLELMK